MNRLYPKTRYGTKYGGYYYPETFPIVPQRILSFGAGEDISHDVHLAHVTGAVVHIFDPTPRALAHIGLVKQVLDGKAEAVNDDKYGGGDVDYWNIIKENACTPELLRMYNTGIYTRDDSLTFYFPQNGDHVSGSLVPNEKSPSQLQVQVKCLRTICNELGWGECGPDILKLDVEGVECEVLQQMITETYYRPMYIAVDFDSARSGLEGLKKATATCDMLYKEGYYSYHFDNWDMTFVRRDISMS